MHDYQRAYMIILICSWSFLASARCQKLLWIHVENNVHDMNILHQLTKVKVHWYTKVQREKLTFKIDGKTCEQFPHIKILSRTHNSTAATFYIHFSKFSKFSKILWMLPQKNGTPCNLMLLFPALDTAALSAALYEIKTTTELQSHSYRPFVNWVGGVKLWGV